MLVEKTGRYKFRAVGTGLLNSIVGEPTSGSSCPNN